MIIKLELFPHKVRYHNVRYDSAISKVDESTSSYDEVKF